MDNLNYQEVTVDAQLETNHMLFEMSLRFKADMETKEGVNICDDLWMESRVMTQDGCSFLITQVVPFIPDEKTIEEYRSILEEKFKTNEKIGIRNVRFDGYEYIRVVKQTKFKRLKDEIVRRGKDEVERFIGKELPSEISVDEIQGLFNAKYQEMSQEQLKNAYLRYFYEIY